MFSVFTACSCLVPIGYDDDDDDDDDDGHDHVHGYSSNAIANRMLFSTIHFF